MVVWDQFNTSFAIFDSGLLRLAKIFDFLLLKCSYLVFFLLLINILNHQVLPENM